MRIELFFDCSCAWAYMGLVNFDRFVARHGIPLTLRPVDMMQVFNTVNRGYLVPEAEIRRRYFAADLREWARFLNIPMADPTPAATGSEACMRACVAASRQDRLRDFAAAAFEALWVHGRDLGDTSVLGDLWTGLGLPETLLKEELAAAGAGNELKSNTQELMARGGFGVPTFFLEDELFFGNDTLQLLELKLRRRLLAI
jgi:2-hydroxychromene-2-carboxylate isomerase